MAIPLTGLCEEGRRPLIAYQASWYETPALTGSATTLARLPGFIDTVILGFAKPDATYNGGLKLSGTGLQYPFTGAVLKDAIQVLKARHPRTRVLVAVGGSGYNNGWAHLDEAAISRLVRDLGADGVDIDYEPPSPRCRTEAGRVVCDSDSTWISLVGRFRAALPRPFVLTIPGWSVCAHMAKDLLPRTCRQAHSQAACSHCCDLPLHETSMQFLSWAMKPAHLLIPPAPSLPIGTIGRDRSLWVFRCYRVRMAGAGLPSPTPGRCWRQY